MPCRDRCQLHLGPAKQRVRSVASAPPAPRSGQKEPHPSFAAPAPPKTLLDQPPRLHTRAFKERVGRASSPPARIAEATPSPLASFVAVGPAADMAAVSAPEPSDADANEPTGVVADAAVDGPVVEDSLVTGATPEDTHTIGEVPMLDGSPAVGSVQSMNTQPRQGPGVGLPRDRGHISILPRSACQPDPEPCPVITRAQTLMPGRFASPPTLRSLRADMDAGCLPICSHQAARCVCHPRSA
ncbi:hypothetical protein ZWY2020_011113 [Hordeum vulgare]|nr:hypothetical protein ZWY2020_011113 [Hordeum vulgare]